MGKPNKNGKAVDKHMGYTVRMMVTSKPNEGTKKMVNAIIKEKVLNEAGETVLDEAGVETFKETKTKVVKFFKTILQKPTVKSHTGKFGLYAGKKKIGEDFSSMSEAVAEITKLTSITPK